MVHNQRGTTALVEYAVTILLVVATLVAMTTYVRRAFQARMRDARHYAIVNISPACDGNCMNAAGLTGKIGIGQQYEPYYAKTDALINQDSLTFKKLSGVTGNFIGQVNTQVSSTVGSEQLPPKEASKDII
jgi:hypothetical protein